MILNHRGLLVPVTTANIGGPERIRTSNLFLLREAPLLIGLRVHGGPGGSRTRRTSILSQGCWLVTSPARILVAPVGVAPT